MKLWIKIKLAFWKMVFWWKHKTGFLDLGEDVTFTGTVMLVDGVGSPTIDNDGDFCFNVKVDFGWEWLNTGFKGRKTTNNLAAPDTIHCEVPPWLVPGLQEKLIKVVTGARIKVTGRWGFDGVHIGKAQWLETLYALWRHQPNVLEGWFEIHPVTDIEII